MADNLELKSMTELITIAKTAGLRPQTMKVKTKTRLIIAIRAKRKAKK